MVASFLGLPQFYRLHEEKRLHVIKAGDKAGDEAISIECRMLLRVRSASLQCNSSVQMPDRQLGIVSI